MFDLQIAKKFDREDPLTSFRNDFQFPMHNGNEVIYLSGNSLGLKSKWAEAEVQKQLTNWGTLGVEGHFVDDVSWVDYHKNFEEGICSLIGAKRTEVVSMGSLTANLHQLLASFYSPQGKKNKILIEKNAFSSDYFAITSQLEHHGLDPAKHLILLEPNDQGFYPAELVIESIHLHADELALVFLGGVNYLTGELFDLQKIALITQELKIPFGVDLAHGIGNVSFELHSWGVDFAVWCTYKYLNGGPGSVGGAFVHERNFDLPKLKGWWGTRLETRFEMKHHFEAIPTAESWQVSNAPVLNMAALKGSLKLFDQAGIDSLRQKSLKLTAYLESLLDSIQSVSILSPRDPDRRGAQLSFVVESDLDLKSALREKGIIIDSRRYKDTSLFRAAPVPLYNSFEDVFCFASHLKELLG